MAVITPVAVCRLPNAANDVFPDASGDRRALGMTLYSAVHIPVMTKNAADVFKALARAAFWIGGNLDGPQPRTRSDNRHAWPLRMNVTTQWKFDAPEKNLVCGFFERGLLLRYWCDVAHAEGARRSWQAAERLHVDVYQALEPHFDKGLRDFIGLDPEITLGHVDAAVRDCAARAGIDLMTDREMAAHCEAVARIGGRV